MEVGTPRPAACLHPLRANQKAMLNQATLYPALVCVGV